MQQSPRYITHKEIDREKWDACVRNAPNCLIYAQSIYLDKMAGNWDALVLNDYELVMPLTWRKKYGIYYLYQPFLCAQLGIFGEGMNAMMLKEFLDAIPAKFRYWDIYLNHGNVLPVEKYDLTRRTNYILDLSPGYEELKSAYRENIARNMKKALQSGCTVQKDFDPAMVIQLAVEQMKGYGEQAGDEIAKFRELYQVLHAKQQAITYGIFSAGNELLSSAIFFFSHNRAYYILVGNHPNGKTIGASHALIDAFIRDHAGRELLLDFEGSEIRNLAFFYSSFGAKEEFYAGLRLNKLPGIIKWLKK